MAPEPTTTAGGAKLLAAALVALSAYAGEFGPVVLCAMAGSFWPVTDSQATTKFAGAKLMARLVLTALVLTGLATLLVARTTGIDTEHLRNPVAFFIALFGERWRNPTELLASIKRALLGRGASK